MSWARQSPSSGVPLPGTTGHVAVWNPATTEMLVWSNELLAYDLSGGFPGRWWAVRTSGSQPQPSGDRAAVYDGTGQRLVYLGQDLWAH